MGPDELFATALILAATTVREEPQRRLAAWRGTSSVGGARAAIQSRA